MRSFTMRKVTIKDIAIVAGVSRGTVDRVINGRGKVSAEAEKKVNKVARELGYEKNLMASTLATSKKYRLAVVCPDPAMDMFWSQPREGMNNALDLVRHYGIEMDYFDFNLFSKESFSLQMGNALASRPDAVLAAPTFFNESTEFLDQASQLGIPFITINTEIQHPGILSFVGQHSYHSGYLAGRLLHWRLSPGDEIIALNLGHSLTNARHYTDKVAGLKAYTEEHGMNENQVFWYECEDFHDALQLKKFWQEIRAAHPGMKGLFFTNSRAYKLVPLILEETARKYVIVGFDMIAPNIEMLKERKIDFIINQNPVLQGYMGILNFVNHFILRKEIQPIKYLPLDIIIRENVDYYLNLTPREAVMAPL